MREKPARRLLLRYAVQSTHPTRSQSRDRPARRAEQRRHELGPCRQAIQSPNGGNDHLQLRPYLRVRFVESVQQPIAKHSLLSIGDCRLILTPLVPAPIDRVLKAQHRQQPRWLAEAIRRRRIECKQSAAEATNGLPLCKHRFTRLSVLRLS